MINRQVIKKSFIIVIALIAVAMATICYPHVYNVNAEENYSYSTLSQTQKETLRYIAEDKINSYIKDENMKLKYHSEVLVNGFDGSEFLVFSFKPTGYSIYSLTNFDAIEIAPFGQSPYNDSKDNLYYAPLVGYFEKINDNKYFDCHTKEVNVYNADDRNMLKTYSKDFSSTARKNIDDSAVATIKSAKNTVPQSLRLKHEIYADGVVEMTSPLRTTSNPGDAENIDLDESNELTADWEAYYSWYFKRNTYQFAQNNGGTCGYVALAMLICYYEFFHYMGYLSYSEGNRFITPCDCEYGTDVPHVRDDFVPYLQGDRENDSIAADLVSAFNDFMAGKNVKFSTWETYLGAGDIKGRIKWGVPSILMGYLPNLNGKKTGHAVIVYGYYEDGGLLTHYGWEYRSQVILRNYVTGAYFGINDKNPHKCNDRFFRNGKKKYCGCGWDIVNC